MHTDQLTLAQQQVVDEYDELFKRTTKLGVFFSSSAFVDISPEEKARMDKQWRLMQQYGQVLSERIAAFK